MNETGIVNAAKALNLQQSAIRTKTMRQIDLIPTVYTHETSRVHKYLLSSIAPEN
jgi:hypothetical protein